MRVLLFLLPALASSASPQAEISTPYLWVANGGVGASISRIRTADGSVEIFPNVGGSYWGAVGPSGDFWTTDSAQSLVRRVSAANGSSTSFDPGLPLPTAIAVDAAEDLYIGQRIPYHAVIKMRGSDGHVLWRTPQVTLGGGAFGIAVDAEGNVWVPDYAKEGKIHKLRGSDGGVLGEYEAGGWPTGIAVDVSGDVWVTNQISGRVTKLSGADGRILGSYAAISNASGIAIDGSGDLWVTNGSRATKLAPDGRVLESYIAGQNPNAGISVDAAGRVWVTNSGLAAVTELSLDGQVMGTYHVAATGGSLGDCTGFALQRFVMRKGGGGGPVRYEAWSRLRDMPLAAQGAAVRAIGDLAYLAGGVTSLSRTQFRAYSSLWSFDPAREFWAKLPDMPCPRYEAAVGANAGILYVAGGSSREGCAPSGAKRVFSSRLEAYDPRRETWTSLASVPTPGMSRGAFLDGLFYVVGAQCSDQMEAYDPKTDSWSRKPPMPTPRCAPAVVVLGGKLYVMGGQGGGAQTRDAVEVYDPKTVSWTALPPMPTARTAFMTAVLGGKIHVMGGWLGSRRLASHEAFDPAVGRWYQAASLPESRSNTGAVALRGKLYVFGGRAGRSNGAQDLDETGHVLVYDPAKDRLRPVHGSPVVAASGPWTRTGDGPIRQQLSAQAEVGGIIYMAGGRLGLSPTTDRDYPDLWVFDPLRETWARLADIPTPRRNAASGVIEGKLYVAGGGVHRELFNRIEVYDPAAGTWTAKSPAPVAGMTRGAVVDNLLYVLGASCGGTFLAYDPRSDSWKDLPPMPTPRCDPGLASVGGKIYALGGHPTSGPPYDIVEVYDPRTGAWSAAPRMPFARTSFATVVIGDRIHLLGGLAGPNGIQDAHQVYDPVFGLWYEAAPLPEARFGVSGTAARGKIYMIGGILASDVSRETASVEVYDPAKDRLRPLPSARPVARTEQPALARVVTSAPDLLPVRKGEPRPDDFALVVGVERYRSLPAADYAERDASAFARYAQAVLGVPEENTILLTGERATKTDIAKYIEEWLPRNVVEDSRVYIFYSGHGAPDPSKGTAHLMPWDGDPAFLQTSAYSLGRLYDRLARLKARDVVVMLDACFSGAGGRSVIASGLRPLVLVQEAVLPQGSKLTVLTAASGDEVAGSLDAQRHGLFTYYLLKGLDGAADPEGRGHVTVGDLHGYVRKNVLRAAHRQNREQNPVLRAPDQRLKLY